MSAIRLGLALAVFAVLATANAGGYRYGVSDQAFYVPAIALHADPSLFARDRAVLEPQMRFWLGDEILGAVVRVTGIRAPVLFGLLQMATLSAVALGVIAIVRALGGDWWTIALALLLVTLRHRISKTGANSLEGYFHPRMLAFGLGLLGLSAAVRGRLRGAMAWTVCAALVHSSTAIWFGGVVLVASLWETPRRLRTIAALAGLGAVAIGVWWLARPSSFAPMSAAWLDVLGSRDYLFSLEWPAYAWIANLGSVAIVLVLYRRRTRLGRASRHEASLVAGLLALVAGFFVTLPFTALRIPFFVQLQANRVFWLVDAVAVLLVAWWIDDLARRRWGHRGRLVVVLTAAALSLTRGVYVLGVETGRPLVQTALDRGTWTDAMTWLGTQPPTWHVLADPQHAARFGSSVRVAGLRDTPLELGKDPAMAMYDEALAARVAERAAALADFDALTLDRLRALDRTYALDVFIDQAARSWPLPVLYRNADFVLYDLR